MGGYTCNLAKPLVIDLFCGLGGWTEAFLDEGWDAIGFDIERHDYGTGGYPGQLVLQDVLTLDGRQFRGRASLIVASPPCQKYSYMAMPWSRSNKLAAWYREDVTRQLQLNCLFNACFRIAHEAELPIVVENVRGAQPWVGGARWHYGSFYFWGDVPALMPPVAQCQRLKSAVDCGPQLWKDREGDFRTGAGIKAGDRNKGRANGEHKWDTAFKSPGLNWNGYGEPGYKPEGFNVRNAQRFREGIKNGNGARDESYRLTEPRKGEGVKMGGQWWNDSTNNLIRKASSKSDSRKAASAMIAKIPYPLAQHIARVFKPGGYQ